MKTDMPFYGVQKPDREPILKAIKKNFRPQSRQEYEKTILKLWKLPHREEKYLALGYACEFVSLATVDTMDLYERLVREGAWWDFVDVLAAHLVGRLHMTCRAEVAPMMDEWISDPDFWIRLTDGADDLVRGLLRQPALAGLLRVVGSEPCYEALLTERVHTSQCQGSLTKQAKPLRTQAARQQLVTYFHG